MQVGIVPSDLTRSMAFYRDVVGLAYRGPLPVKAGRTLHLFDADGATLKLIELGPDDVVPVGPLPGPFTAAVGLRWLTLDVTDLDDIARRAAETGARWQLSIAELRPGLRVGIVEDPDGNAVELVERRAS